MAISSHQEKLEDVLDGRRQYIIPDYQRPYVWSWDQAQDLAEDLLAAWRRGDSDFFLGSIVLIREGDSQIADVVDGQQRLTTLAILFAVIREFIEDRLKRALDNRLTTQEDLLRGIEAQPRVVVREADRHFFNTHIVDGDLLGLREQPIGSLETEGQRNMRRSLDAIWETLSDLEDDGEMRDFLGFVQEISLIIVETDNFQNAHRVFGVLNTRGVPLAAADVFKAKVLGAIPEDYREEYAEKWDDALQPLERDPDAFFRHLLVSVVKRAPRLSLAETFEKEVGSRLIRDTGAREFIDEKLVPLARAYLTVEDSLGDDVEQVLGLLHDHRSSEWKPVAMWIVDNVDDPDEKTRLLRGLDRVLGLHTMGGSTKTTRAEAMTTLLQRLENSSFLGEVSVPDSAFSVPDTVLYNAVAALHGMLPRSSKRVMLLRRAHWQATGPEGVMPASSTWISVFPSEPVPEMHKGTNVDNWRSRLGSMVLSTTANSRIKNAQSWIEICSLTDPGQDAQLSTVTTLDPLRPTSEDMLQHRQQELIRLVTGFWSAQHDSNGLDLLSLNEAQLLGFGGRGRVARSKPTRLEDVFRVGLLSPGDVLVWERPEKKQKFEVVVTDNGAIRLPNGTLATSPTGAAKQVSGSNVSGISVWKRASDGVALRTLWNRYEKQFSDAPGQTPSGKVSSKKAAPSPTTSSKPETREAPKLHKSSQSPNPVFSSATTREKPLPSPAPPKSTVKVSRFSHLLRNDNEEQTLKARSAARTERRIPEDPPNRAVQGRKQGGLGPQGARAYLWDRQYDDGAEQAASEDELSEQTPNNAPQSVKTNIDLFLKAHGALKKELTRTRRSWIWHTVVSNPLMRERTSLIPAGLAKAVGVGPGHTRIFSAHSGESIAVTWDEKGPSLGDVRRLLIRNHILAGDNVSLSFFDDGLIDVYSMAEADYVDEADETYALDARLEAVPGRRASPTKWTIECLDLMGAEYEDRRGKGGSLWVFGGDDVAAVVQSANEAGAGFAYSDRTHSGRPGWWTSRKR